MIDYANMWVAATKKAVDLKIEMATKDAKIAKLEAALKPFADLSRHWNGDKLPLQIKLILLDPLPVLYATKALSESEE